MPDEGDLTGFQRWMYNGHRQAEMPAGSAIGEATQKRIFDGVRIVFRSRPRWQMKHGFTKGSLVTATVLAVCACLSSLPGLATEVDQARLPVTVPNLCMSCHLVEQPNPSNFELNPFGVDYLANGRIWDSNLANLDSDGDGCLNGVEVGDSDGDGHPDGNVESQAGNPGIPDECGSGSLVDEKTWGALKAMFDGR
jgi:hypothetical protein